MKRLVAIVGTVVLSAGLIGWAAFVEGQWNQFEKPTSPSNNPPTGGTPVAPLLTAPIRSCPNAGACQGVTGYTTPLTPAEQSSGRGSATATTGTIELTTPPTVTGRDPHVNSTITSEARGGRQEPAVRLEWVGAPVLKVGQTGLYRLVVCNTCPLPVQQVLVRVRVPAALRCMNTTPQGGIENNVLVWNLGVLQPKQEKSLQMKLLAEQKGDAAPQAWVTFTGSSVLHIAVREPKLVVKAQGPAKVLVGEPATFDLTVANPGDGPAEQVKIHAMLSEGLERVCGTKVDFDIGNLAMGETRHVAVRCVGRAGGVQKCEVIAEADGGLSAREATALSVIMPKLDLQMIGPGMRFLGRKALYTFRVSNPGDAPANNVTVSDVVPDGFKVLAASDSGRLDTETRTVSWTLGDLQPGQSQEVKLEVQAVEAGEFKHKGSALARGLSAESELTTQIEGLSALLLELVDTDDPVEVNGETSYKVRITNTGSKVETNIRLAATVPDKMEFKSAIGPVRYHEEGRSIVFEPIEHLAPKAEATFRINVKALDAATVRFKIQLTSTNLTEPVIKMEATRIYADAPEVKSSDVRKP